MHCIEREFEAVGDAEFVKNVVEMILHGLLADEESYADFLVSKALGDELDDFLLAVGCRPAICDARRSRMWRRR